MSDAYSRLLAGYACAVRYEDLPRETVHEVKRRVLDSLGVALAALNEDAPQRARAYARHFDHPAGATLWGSDARVTPEAAAFANGVAVRYLDFNDTYLSLEPLHPSDVIPGLMALCQWARLPTEALIASVAVAYEVGVCLCDAASLRAHGWDHVNYTAIAAACGAGNLLGLSEGQVEHAVAMTAVPHASMRQTRAGELSMWKGAAAANAVRNALFATLLARQGFTGPFSPFTGEMGFFRQLLDGESFDEKALKSLREGAPPRRILDTYIKKWPVEYHAQSAVDAAQAIAAGVNGAASIRSVRIDTFKAAYEIIAKDPEKWAPKTRETADHSLPYIVAVTLIDGRVTKESFAPEKLTDPQVRRLLQDTTLEEDDELTKGYPEGIPNRLTVRTRDGAALTEEVRWPRGHARNPMSDQEVVDKFMANVRGVLPEEKARRAVDLAMSLERLEGLEPLMEAVAI